MLKGGDADGHVPKGGLGKRTGRARVSDAVLRWSLPTLTNATKE